MRISDGSSDVGPSDLKPADIVEKMVEGGVRKFVSESTLMGQVFVIDGKTKIADVIAKAGKDLGAPVSVPAFVRFQLGEGRSEGRRVGKECVSTCRIRWSPYH